MRRRLTVAQASFFDAGLLEITFPYHEVYKLGDTTFTFDLEPIPEGRKEHFWGVMVGYFSANASDRSHAGYSGPIKEGESLTEIVAQLKEWARNHMKWQGQVQTEIGEWVWPGGEDPYKVYMRQQREKYGENYSEEEG